MPAKKKQPARIPRSAQTAAASYVTAELSTALAKLSEVHGQGIVTRGDQMPAANHIPTGAFCLDMALCGGFAQGYASMIYGFESSGKTLVMLLAIAGFQRKYPDKVAVFIDAEKLYDKGWAQKLGVDTTRLLVITPDTGEQAVDTMHTMLHVDAVGLIVLDSLPACAPATIDERSAEDKTMGALAALLGTLCSKIITSWGRERRRGHYVTVLLANQWRMKVGGRVMPGMPPPTTLPGGRQINHLPTTKIAMKGSPERVNARKPAEGGGGDGDGDAPAKDTVIRHTEISFKMEKTKHGASITQGAFSVVLAGGHESGLPVGSVDDCGTVVVYAIRFGLITGRYQMPAFTEETWAKKEHIVTWLRANKDVQSLLRATLIAIMRQRHGLTPFPPDDSLEGIQNVSLKIPEGILEQAAASGIDDHE